MFDVVTERFPNFDEALAQLREWLSGRKLPAEVGWVFCEDITWYRKRFLVRLPLPADNISVARAWYATGVRVAGAIRFDVNCASSDVTYCSVWFPGDSCDTAYWPHKGFRIHQHPAFGQARCTGPHLFWWFARTWSSLNYNTGPLCDIPYRKYASNQQGGANEGQPLRSEADRTSPAAAPRGSP